MKSTGINIKAYLLTTFGIECLFNNMDKRHIKQVIMPKINILLIRDNETIIMGLEYLLPIMVIMSGLQRCISGKRRY